MPYGNYGNGGMGYGMGMGYGSTIPMQGRQVDMAAVGNEYQGYLQNQARTQIFNQSAMQGQMDLEAAQIDKDKNNAFANMIAQNQQSSLTAPQNQGQAQPTPQTTPQQTQSTPQSTPQSLSNPVSIDMTNQRNSGAVPGTLTATPGSNLTQTDMTGARGDITTLLKSNSTPTSTPLADHSAVQNFLASTPNTHPDTSKAVDPDNPTFASKHTWDSVDPQTGVITHNTFDRQGLIDQMMNYTDKHGNHIMALDAQKLMQNWQIYDAADEKNKQDTKAAQTAGTLGQIAAFSYMTPEQQKLTYENMKKRVVAAGGDISDFPADITSDAGQAWLQDKQNQAQMDNTTAKNSAEMAKNAIDKQKASSEEFLRSAQALEAQAKADQGPSIINKNNQEAFKAYQEGLKAQSEGNGTPGQNELVGPAYLSTLTPPQSEWLRGVATGDITINPRSKEGIAAMKAASQAFPGIDISGAQKWKADMGKVNAGTSGGVTIGVMKSMEHLDSMSNLDKTGGTVGGPGFVAKPLNSLYNLGASAGNAESAWNAGHAALMNEMSRSFKGGPSGENEVVRDMKNLKYSDSPARKASVYQEYTDLLLGQSSAVEAQRQSLLKGADPGTSILNQKTIDRVQKFHNGQLPAGMLPAFDSSTANAPKGNVSSANNETPMPKVPSGYTIDQALKDAQTAITNGADKTAVLSRSKALGFDLSGKIK